MKVKSNLMRQSWWSAIPLWERLIFWFVSYYAVFHLGLWIGGRL